MKFLNLVVLFSSVFGSLSSPANTNLSSNTEDNFFSVYCYFDKFSISNDGFDVKITTYRLDGETYEAFGEELKSANIAKTPLSNKLWTFVIPVQSQMSKFEIIRKETGAIWSTTALCKIEGCVFHFDMESYSSISENTGWKELSITYDQFADYFASRIDESSNNQINGYGVYPLQNKYIYQFIKDESETPDTIIWYDSVKDDNITLREKWDILYKLSKTKTNQKRIGEIFVKILGLLTALFSIGLFVIFYRKVIYGKDF